MATTLLTRPGNAPGKRPESGPSSDLLREVPHSTPCPGCSGPVEPGDAFCPSCGLALGRPDEKVATKEVATRGGFKCENCGAEVRCEPGMRSTSCPFCAAPYVVELGPQATGKQAPEFVLGFAITPDRATLIYRQWIAARAWFRPKDLAMLAQSDAMKGIYLPFWSFSVRADSSWSASIGEHWQRTETYTERDDKGNVVTKTRQVTETEWWPLSGGHHAFYSFYLVSASKGLPQEVSEWVQPYQLGALKRYTADYLAGWLCEDYSIERDAAYARTEDEFRAREVAAIRAFLPGDTSTVVQVDTTFSDATSDLILLPLYLLSYRYRGKLYRTLINGQTGKVEGEKPVSVPRIILMVVGVLVVIALIVLGIVGLSR
jgi:hypothetical protein